MLFEQPYEDIINTLNPYGVSYGYEDPAYLEDEEEYARELLEGSDEGRDIEMGR